MGRDLLVWSTDPSGETGHKGLSRLQFTQHISVRQY